MSGRQDVCRRCRARIIWATRTTTGKRWPLDAAPVASSGPECIGAVVVLGDLAYGPTELRDHLAVNRQIPLDTAERLVRDEHDWHRVHRCEQATKEATR